MSYYILKSQNSLEDNRFKSISDFKWCMKCGGEVEIEWNGICYGIIRYGTDDKITIYVWNRPETECCFDTADDALEYMVGSDRLRDLITQVTVLDRTISDKNLFLTCCESSETSVSEDFCYAKA